MIDRRMNNEVLAKNNHWRAGENITQSEIAKAVSQAEENLQ